jgi:hypothetical protein
MDFDTAASLSDSYRAAFCIIFSELEGSKFNFNSWKFEEQKK